MSAYLGFPFVDSAEVVRFNENGDFDSEKTDELLRAKLAEMPKAVIRDSTELMKTAV